MCRILSSSMSATRVPDQRSPTSVCTLHAQQAGEPLQRAANDTRAARRPRRIRDALLFGFFHEPFHAVEIPAFDEHAMSSRLPANNDDASVGRRNASVNRAGDAVPTGILRQDCRLIGDFVVADTLRPCESASISEARRLKALRSTTEVRRVSVLACRRRRVATTRR